MSTSRTAAVTVSAAAVIAFVTAGCGPATQTSGSPTSPVVSSPTPAASSSAVAASPAAAETVTRTGPARWGIAPQTVRVTGVHDGDTFYVAGGGKVRPLGIDSCEVGTQGGTVATRRAHALLDGQTVILSREPGADRDRYGRELRYVQVDGRDYGEQMVVGRDTAVYAKGHDDSSPTYTADLRRLDTDGRDCGGPAPTDKAPASSAPASTAAQPSPRTHAPVPRTHAPAPTTRVHTGHTGHPCLPGERDGDHDGFCGEGKH